MAHFYLDEPENELLIWFSQTLTENAFSERLSNGGYTRFVYEQNDKIIGYISLKKPNHLYHLFILEQFQGKGISRLLWEHVKNSGQHGSFTLRSSVYAVPIYKRFGFCESGQISTKDGLSFQPMQLKM